MKAIIFACLGIFVSQLKAQANFDDPFFKTSTGTSTALYMGPTKNADILVWRDSAQTLYEFLLNNGAKQEEIGQGRTKIAGQELICIRAQANENLDNYSCEIRVTLDGDAVSPETVAKIFDGSKIDPDKIVLTPFTTQQGTSKVSTLKTDDPTVALLGLEDQPFISIEGDSAELIYKYFVQSGIAPEAIDFRMAVKGKTVTCFIENESKKYGCELKVTPSGDLIGSLK